LGRLKTRRFDDSKDLIRAGRWAGLGASYASLDGDAQLRELLGGATVARPVAGKAGATSYTAISKSCCDWLVVI